MKRKKSNNSSIQKGLRAPLDYYEASKEERDEIINRCGPDGFLNKFIPDHLFGLSIAEVCNIHDWEFSKARSQKDLKRADLNFKNNLMWLINKKSSNGTLKFLREAAAKVYYWVVRVYSKNKNYLS